MIRPDVNARQRLVADGEGNEVDVTEPAHANLGEEPPGGEPANGVHASIDEFVQSYETGEPLRRVAAFRAARRKTSAA